MPPCTGITGIWDTATALRSSLGRASAGPQALVRAAPARGRTDLGSCLLGMRYCPGAGATASSVILSRRAWNVCGPYPHTVDRPTDELPARCVYNHAGSGLDRIVCG